MLAMAVAALIEIVVILSLKEYFIKLYKLFFTNEENIAGANSEKGQLIVVTNYCDLISTLYYFYIEFSNNNGKRGGGG